jgi:hypothetical protein
MQQKFENFEEAQAYFNGITYSNVELNTNEIEFINDKEVSVLGMNYELDKVFFESIFKFAKLPNKNKEILPTENIINDLNTILKTEKRLTVIFKDNIPYTLYESDGKKPKIITNHKDFLNSIINKIDPEDSEVYLCDNLLKIKYIKKDEEIINFNDKNYKLGLNIVNGEIYKTYPTIINSLLEEDDEARNVILMPFIKKNVRITGAATKEALDAKINKSFEEVVFNRNLITERLERINNFQINDEIIRYACGFKKFLKEEEKLELFQEMFKVNDKGKLTKVINKTYLEENENKTFYQLIQDLTVFKSKYLINDFEKEYKSDLFIMDCFYEKNKALEEVLS